MSKKLPQKRVNLLYLTFCFLDILKLYRDAQSDVQFLGQTRTLSG